MKKLTVYLGMFFCVSCSEKVNYDVYLNNDFQAYPVFFVISFIFLFFLFERLFTYILSFTCKKTKKIVWPLGAVLAIYMTVFLLHYVSTKKIINSFIFTAKTHICESNNAKMGYKHQNLLTIKETNCDQRCRNLIENWNIAAQKPFFMAEYKLSEDEKEAFLSIEKTLKEKWSQILKLPPEEQYKASQTLIKEQKRLKETLGFDSIHSTDYKNNGDIIISTYRSPTAALDKLTSFGTFSASDGIWSSHLTINHQFYTANDLYTICHYMENEFCSIFLEQAENIGIWLKVGPYPRYIHECQSKEKYTFYNFFDHLIWEEKEISNLLTKLEHSQNACIGELCYSIDELKALCTKVSKNPFCVRFLSWEDDWHKRESQRKIEREKRAEQKRVEQQKRAEQERVEREKRAEQERVERETKECIRLPGHVYLNGACVDKSEEIQNENEQSY